jgi:hypothetical protein
MFADTYTYLSAVLGHWWSGYWYLTGVPEALILIFPNPMRHATAWLDRAVSPNTRLSIYRWIFVGGLLVAGFLSWDEQYQRAGSTDPRDPTSKQSEVIRDLARQGSSYSADVYCLETDERFLSVRKKMDEGS